jgi:hypothetical protein
MPGASASADVFALGCVLWECVVGRSPFHASHPASMLAKTLYDPSPGLRTELPSAPLALHALLARMMEKRVEERIADGAQRITLSLVDGSDLKAALARVRAAGMHVDQALDELGVLVGHAAEEAIPALEALPDVEHVEAEGSVQLPPPDSETQ